MKKAIFAIVCLWVALFWLLSCSGGGKNADSAKATTAKPSQSVGQVPGPSKPSSLAGPSNEQQPLNSDQITDVSQLPANFQYSDEEWKQLMKDFKTEPDIQIDPKNSEVVNCKDCAIILYGHLLYPPFFLTILNSQLFLNGYQFYPLKLKPLLHPLLNHKKSALSTFNSSTIDNLCNESNKKIDKAIIHIGRSHLDPKEMDTEIRNELNQMGATIYELSLSKDYLHIIYQATPECNINKWGFKLQPIYSFSTRDNNMSSPSILSSNNNTSHLISLFKSNIMDDRFIIPWDINGGGETGSFMTISIIYNILSSHVSNNQLLFMLVNKSQISAPNAVYIIVNAKEYIDVYRSHK